MAVVTMEGVRSFQANNVSRARSNDRGKMSTEEKSSIGRDSEKRREQGVRAGVCESRVPDNVSAYFSSEAGAEEECSSISLFFLIN